MQNEELRRSQEQLDVSKARYFDLYDLAPVGYLTLSNKKIIREINLSAATMLGVDRSELVKEPISMILPRDDQNLFYQHLKKCVEECTPQNWEMRLLRNDSSLFWAHLQVSLAKNGEYWIVLQDITERKRAAEERIKSAEHLSALNRQLRALNEHLHTVVEQERLAISRDIHDDLGQNLTIMKLDLNWLRKNIPDESSESHKRLNEMHECVEQFKTKVQRIAANLRPPLLDNMGLAVAIEWQVAEFRKHSGLTCFMLLNEDIEILDMKTSTTVIRIIQEGLTNIARHAGATEANISLCKDAGGLLLEISDNGSGITPQQINSPKAYGLMGMQERARNCYGELKISGSLACGTTLTLLIPLDRGACP